MKYYMIKDKITKMTIFFIFYHLKYFITFIITVMYFYFLCLGYFLKQICFGSGSF